MPPAAQNSREGQVADDGPAPADALQRGPITTSAAKFAEMLQKAKSIVNEHTKEDLYFKVRAKGEAREISEKTKMLKGVRNQDVKDFQETHFPVHPGKWERNVMAFFLNQENDLTQTQKKEVLQVWNTQLAVQENGFALDYMKKMLEQKDRELAWMEAETKRKTDALHMLELAYGVSEEAFLKALDGGIV